MDRTHDRPGPVPGDVNFDDPVGKVVGHRVFRPRHLSSERDSRRATRAWCDALQTPFIPRGVFRFRSFEEADEWTWNMISRRTES